MALIVPFRIVRPAAKVRLFCFPFAGSGANVYRTWAQLFGDGIEVCPVELPGRGVRTGEPVAKDMATLQARLLEDLAPFLEDGKPIALFGHSMGAKLAFEISKQLGPRVVHLFASAAGAPNIVPPSPLSHLQLDELIVELRRMGGTPEEVLADRDLMELFSPLLRADLGLHEHYLATDATRAPCGITTFAATADPRVPIHNARGWESFSGGAFRFISLDAGHFFLGSAAAMLAREIVADLTTAVGPI